LLNLSQPEGRRSDGPNVPSQLAAAPPPSPSLPKMGAVCCAESEGRESKPIEAVEALSAPAGVSDSKLSVTIAGASGLRGADWRPGSGRSDCYVAIVSKETELYKTEAIRDSLQPTWMDTVALDDWEDGAALEFHVFDGGPDSFELLGKAVLEASKFAESGFNGNVKIESTSKALEEAFLKLQIKVKDKELPTDLLPGFKITVEKRKDESYGLDLDMSDGRTFLIVQVKEGACKVWNESAKPDEQLLATDFIIAVNGVSGRAEDMLAEFQSTLTAELEVRRCTVNTVIIDNEARKPHGLEFPSKLAGRALIIAGISEGAVSAFNATAGEEDRIDVGDRISAVSGIKGKAKQLQAKLNASDGFFQLTVLRPGSPERRINWCVAG